MIENIVTNGFDGVLKTPILIYLWPCLQTTQYQLSQKDCHLFPHMEI